MQPFYPGQEGGRAIAQLLTGQINFSAKLPFTVAQRATDYPAFSNLGSQAPMDYLHGYRKFEAEQLPVRYWFGHGLSYTTYEYSAPTVLCSQVSSSGRLNVEVTVTNTGSVAGDEIVQLYVGYPNTQVRRPVKELKTFARVTLQPGASERVQLSVPASDLAYFDMVSNSWVLETGLQHSVIVAPSADPVYNATHSASFTIGQ